MTTERKLIEKRKELINKIFNKHCISINNIFCEYVIKDKRALINELTSLEVPLAKEQEYTGFTGICGTINLPSDKKQEPEHDTCDGCQMMQDCGCMLDDSCAPCFEHSQWTPRVEEPERVTAEEILFKNEIGFLTANPCLPRVIKAMEAYAKSKQINLREELEKYDIKIYHNIHTEETSKIIVDEYLKYK